LSTTEIKDLKSFSRVSFWSQLVAASAVITGLIWIFGCLIWPEQMPRKDYFIDGFFLLIGSSIIYLLHNIAERMFVSAVNKDIAASQKKRADWWKSTFPNEAD